MEWKWELSLNRGARLELYPIVVIRYQTAKDFPASTFLRS